MLPKKLDKISVVDFPAQITAGIAMPLPTVGGMMPVLIITEPFADQQPYGLEVTVTE
jgi:hypothetical protein